MSTKDKINIVASENMTNKDIIQYLALNNDKNYNLLKCTEELSELQTILLQNINKENAEDQIKAIVLESEKLRVQKNIKKVKKNILPYNFQKLIARFRLLLACICLCFCSDRSVF